MPNINNRGRNSNRAQQQACAQAATQVRRVLSEHQRSNIRDVVYEDELQDLLYDLEYRGDSMTAQQRTSRLTRIISRYSSRLAQQRAPMPETTPNNNTTQNPTYIMPGEDPFDPLDDLYDEGSTSTLEGGMSLGELLESRTPATRPRRPAAPTPPTPRGGAWQPVDVGLEPWNSSEPANYSPQSPEACRCTSCFGRYGNASAQRVPRLRSTNVGNAYVCDNCLEQNYYWSEPQQTYIRFQDSVILVMANQSQCYVTAEYAREKGYVYAPRAGTFFEPHSGIALCNSCARDMGTPHNTTRGEQHLCRHCESYQWTHSNIMGVWVHESERVILYFEDSNRSAEYITRDFALSRGYIEARGDRYNRNRGQANFYESAEAMDRNLCYLLEYSANPLELALNDQQRNKLQRRITKRELLLGVELEMEANPEIVDPRRITINMLIRALLNGDTSAVSQGRFVLKSDGSLSNGVEMCTVPLLLEEHIEKFGWSDLLSRVQPIAIAGTKTTNCGMHVHINKRALSAFQAGKMLVMINSHKPQMIEMLEMIAQRKFGRYCARKDKSIKNGHYDPDYSHYDVLSVRDHTLELRMFRANLRWERVFKNLEFTHALATYCKDASPYECEDRDCFYEWLVSRRGQYRYLTAFLKEKQVPQFSKLPMDRARLIAVDA